MNLSLCWKRTCRRGGDLCCSVEAGAFPSLVGLLKSPLEFERPYTVPSERTDCGSVLHCPEVGLFAAAC